MPIPGMSEPSFGSGMSNGRWRRGVVGVTLSIGLLWGAGGALGQTPDTVRLTTGEWPPYTSEHAPHYGFASHIVSEAFALVGIKVEYGFFPWKRTMKLAREGKWDGSIVWFETEARRAKFYYADPIVTATNSFFYLKGSEFDWKDFEDLKDLRVGGTLEYSYGRAFDEAEAAGVFRTFRAISDEVGLTNLLKGRIDVFPGELLVTYEQIRNTFSAQDAARFTDHSKHISEPPLHLILSKKVPGNARLRDLFNDGLKRLKKSGKYGQIIGDGLSGKYAMPK